tara:strand:- start:248 stop:385 length:138 start_codon:yes stop_codon:yes gene_type:complete
LTLIILRYDNEWKLRRTVWEDTIKSNILATDQSGSIMKWSGNKNN